VDRSWLLDQGDDVAPIPGTKRVSGVEENTAADRLELSAEQVERLNNLTPAAGERHEEAQMAVIDRRAREASPNAPGRGRRLRLLPRADSSARYRAKRGRNRSLASQSGAPTAGALVWFWRRIDRRSSRETDPGSPHHPSAMAGA
jgi:hypothetical protein